MGTTFTTITAVLKEHYDTLTMENLSYAENVGIGLIPKKNKPMDGGGKYWVQPVRTSMPGGGSTDFATAMAATNNSSQYDAFQVTRAFHYRLAKVDTNTIMASQDPENAFEPAFKEFDHGLESEGAYLNFRFYRTSGGYFARMTNTTFATKVMTLDDPSGVWAVRKGDVINLSTTDGTSGSVHTGSLTVASVQLLSGTITTTANISTGISAAAANDYIFLAGDFAGAAPSNGVGAISGLLDWIPDAAPSNTLFYNVDRSTAPDLLGGIRVDGTGGSTLHEVMIDMMANAQTIGGSPETFIMNPLTTGQLAKQLDGKWMIIKPESYDNGDLEIGYKGWEVELNGKTASIHHDKHCQRAKIWGLEMSTWALFSTGRAPEFLFTLSGLPMLKPSESSDSSESRIGFYANCACSAAGWNVNASILTT